MKSFQFLFTSWSSFNLPFFSCLHIQSTTEKIQSLPPPHENLVFIIFHNSLHYSPPQQKNLPLFMMLNDLCSTCTHSSCAPIYMYVDVFLFLRLIHDSHVNIFLVFFLWMSFMVKKKLRRFSFWGRFFTQLHTRVWGFFYFIFIFFLGAWTFISSQLKGSFFTSLTLSLSSSYSTTSTISWAEWIFLCVVLLLN